MKYLLSFLLLAVPITKPSQVKYNQNGTGAAERTLASKLGDAVSVMDFCLAANVNGVTDNTTCLQNALNVGGDIFIPGGTYIVNGDSAFTGGGKDCVDGGIAPLSNSSVLLAPDAILKAKANSTGNYCVVRIKGVTNVRISGGTIDGNKANGTGPGGSQYGYAIGIVGSSNIVVDSMLLQNNWGDGLVIDGSRAPDPVVQSSNILINNIVSDSNRRQGLSIIHGTDVLVQNSVFSNSSGVSPQDGIDIEPGVDGNNTQRITVIGCNAKNNAGHGISVQGTSAGTNVSSINLTGNTSTSNAFSGIQVYTVSGGVTISGNSTPSNTQDGIHIELASAVTVTGNHANSNTRDGLVVAGLSSNVSLSGNEARANRIGINIYDAAAARPLRLLIVGNTIQENLQHGMWMQNTDDSAIIGNVFDSNGQSANNTYQNLRVWTTNRLLVNSNQMRQGTLTNKPGYGLELASDVDVHVVGNDFTNSGVSGDVLQSSPTRYYFRENRWTSTSLDGMILGAALATFRTAPTYGASVAIDASLGNEYVIIATNATAFTIANPTNAATGQRIAIRVKNTSGGGLGAATWGTLYKLAAWAQPATGFSRTIDFQYDGTNWVEAARTPADVPN